MAIHPGRRRSHTVIHSHPREPPSTLSCHSSGLRVGPSICPAPVRMGPSICHTPSRPEPSMCHAPVGVEPSLCPAPVIRPRQQGPPPMPPVIHPSWPLSSLRCASIPSALPACKSYLLNIILILVLCICLSDAALHSPPEENKPKSSNCTHPPCPPSAKVEVNVKLLPTRAETPRQKDGGMQRYSHDNSSSSEPEVQIAVQEDRHHWKTKIIIGCTIAAAVEIIIVIFIAVYWKEIRWTMRKISCPCDERAPRRRDHEAMERSMQDTSATDVQEEDGDIQEVQIYAIPSLEQEEPHRDQEDPYREARHTEEDCLEVTEV